MKKTALGVLFIALHALPVTPASGPDNALPLARAIGGQVEDLVVSAPYAYVATGRVVVTWKYAGPNVPVQVSAVEEPAGGRLTGLVKLGAYLYASWQTGYDSSGVAVYSLADRAQPELVNQVRIDAGVSHVQAIVAANNHVFLFDSENGMMVGSVDDPERPVFTMIGVGAGVHYDQTFTDGTWVHAFGKDWLGNAVLTSFDVSTPQAPKQAPSFIADGVEVFSLRYEAPFAIAFGSKLSVLDLSNPNEPRPRGSAAGPPSMMGILNGEAAYGVGFDGLDVWNIGDPDNPRPVNHVDVDTLATDATASVPGGALMVTRTDRFVHLDTSKTMAPTERASVPMPGSIDAYDAALVADTVLFLQQNYGLAIADAATLDVVGRYEFGLPSALQDRVFNDMHVDGTLAYLAAWGYGLFIVDVSNPRAPIELARQPFPFAHTVSVANGYAYVGKNTEGAEIGIMDVSNPEQPSLLARYSLPYNPAQLEARDGLLYIAAYSGSGAGLRIADVRNPSGASELGYYNEGCANAFGVVLAEAIPMAYVACSNGLHIVDTSNPARPKRIGYAPVEERGDPRISLAIRGGRAWYGSGAGVYEIDISHPRWPRHVGFTDIGGYGPVNMRAIGDNRVLALTGIAGIHVFEPAASDGATPLVNHRPVIGLSGDRGTELLYTIDVSSRARVLRFLTLGRRGDITLLVKRGAAPTTTDYDARSTRPGSHEATQIIRPKPGTWYVKIVGETKFDRVVLLGSYR